MRKCDSEIFDLPEFERCSDGVTDGFPLTKGGEMTTERGSLLFEFWDCCEVVRWCLLLLGDEIRRKRCIGEELILEEVITEDAALWAVAVAGEAEPSAGPELRRTGCRTDLGGLTRGDSLRSVLNTSTDATCRIPMFRPTSEFS